MGRACFRTEAAHFEDQSVLVVLAVLVLPSAVVLPARFLRLRGRWIWALSAAVRAAQNADQTAEERSKVCSRDQKVACSRNRADQFAAMVPHPADRVADVEAPLRVAVAAKLEASQLL
jgi:hypothetical protein